MASQKRSYSSKSRQASAELTRQGILAATRTLFAQQGFEKTTIADVAKLAEVSTPSVYALYKSKEGLLRELIRSAAFNEEYTTQVQKVVSGPDPIEALKTAATITRLVCEAEKAEIGFIRGATILSPEFKALEHEGEQIRYDRQQVLVQRLFDAKIVKPDLDFDNVRAILWSLTSREMYRMMVLERQWSPEKYEQWLATTLIQLLIDEAALGGKEKAK